MEKSIETIWKNGFLKNDALIAPQLNDLYNKKSEHLVDKFTRMFKINLIVLIALSFFILVMSYLVKIPYMGIGFFFILNAVVLINKKLLKGLLKIDKSENSFQYLKTFDTWMKEQININEKLSRFIYPLAVLSVIIGFWFGSFGGDVPGERLVNKLTEHFPDMLLLFGIPLYGWLALILIIILLAYFGGRIYKFDLSIVYGRVLKKLDEIIEDMEELRN